MIRADLDALVGEKSRQFGDSTSADAARALHLRRQLAAAVDHGTDLLAALGLPRLVGPDFAPIDLRAAGDALEAAVAALDALDADPDAEPWLGWTAAGAIGAGQDAEHDTADTELDLGWSALHSQLRLGDNTPDGDLTALERAGRGFVRSGPDDSEDSDPAEEDDEPGRDDTAEPYLSAVEWDGRGDNWSRTGHATSGLGTDIELCAADLEDGDEDEDGRGDTPELRHLAPARYLARLLEVGHG